MNWLIDEYIKLPASTSPLNNVEFLTRAREISEQAKIALTSAKEHKYSENLLLTVYVQILLMFVITI